MLGFMYAWGEGVLEDHAMAERWLGLAAEGGQDVQAQYELGVMYDTGGAVPEDNARAVRWYRLASERGHVAAQGRLGAMYEQGEGVPLDRVEAYAWFCNAAVQGHQLAKQGEKRVAESMSEEELVRGQRLAGEYWKVSCERLAVVSRQGARRAGCRDVDR